MRDRSVSMGFSSNQKPGLQMTVPEAKGAKAEQKRIKEIARLGKLFDKAMNPKLSPRTRINKLYLVRKGYVDAGFSKYLAPRMSELIAIEKEKLKVT